MSTPLSGHGSGPLDLSQRRAWQSRYDAVRHHSLVLTQPLSAEDQQLQSMPDASPTKWHLAHTTWFFDVMVLSHLGERYRVFDTRFHHLFNSYYEALGSRHPRPQRGLLSRPLLSEVWAWRRHVDEAMMTLLDQADQDTLAALQDSMVLGLHHEQQHQELIVTDIKHAMSFNPLATPIAGVEPVLDEVLAHGESWLEVPGGVHLIGHDGDGFAFDNEGPCHQVLLQPFALARTPVTCGQVLEFIASGGYTQPRWWLSDGWAQVQQASWQSPAYWRCDDPDRIEDPAVWRVFTLRGWEPLNVQAPACHLSHYEADAVAHWAGARLPTEFEWEVATGLDADLGTGQVWEWTSSAYAPYPGFRPAPGAVGEYNGKFMVNQMVLRGGSQATPPGHVRRTYRNFFPPAARWQFSGLRLARDLR